MNVARRPWFQIHLSTILVLTIAGGMFISLNLGDYERYGVVGWPRQFLIVSSWDWRIDTYELFCESLFASGSFFLLTLYLETRARRISVDWFLFTNVAVLLSMWFLYWLNFRPELICTNTGVPVGFWWGWPWRMTECGYSIYRRWDYRAAGWNLSVAAGFFSSVIYACWRCRAKLKESTASRLQQNTGVFTP
jgi:hypothetical protein